MTFFTVLGCHPPRGSFVPVTDTSDVFPSFSVSGSLVNALSMPLLGCRVGCWSRQWYCSPMSSFLEGHWYCNIYICIRLPALAWEPPGFRDWVLFIFHLYCLALCLAFLCTLLYRLWEALVFGVLCKLFGDYAPSSELWGKEIMTVIGLLFLSFTCSLHLL